VKVPTGEHYQDFKIQFLGQLYRLKAVRLRAPKRPSPTLGWNILKNVS
jgi:hypothetical protein